MNIVDTVIEEAKYKAPRFELKYAFTDHDQLQEVLKELCVFEQWPSRVVNTIYYDTVSFDFFKCVSRKAKVRVRWYDTKPTQAHLELKTKVDGLCFKHIIPSNLVDPFCFVETEPLKEAVKTLNKKLCVAYYRDYYTLCNSEFRLTVDKHICFDNKEPMDYWLLELKFPYEQLTLLPEVSKIIGKPFIQHSKYKLGISKTTNFM